MGKKYTEDELKSCSKEALITLLLSMQDQVERLNKNMENLIEQIAMANQQRFGRSSEKLDDTMNGEQLHLFNEADKLTEALCVLEPELEDICKPKSRKKKGKREEDLKDLPITIINHELTDDELKEIFGEKWKRLPDEIYKRLRYNPATYEVEEHHVAVYAGMDNQTMIKADRPVGLLRNSIVTPSLLAAITNGKYVNALPLNRIEQEFKRNELNIPRQLMASWLINCSDKYLSSFYNRLHELFLGYHVVQADETPVLVAKDGRSAGSKSYMWVYRTGSMYDKTIVLYDYQKTRKADHPRIFLKCFKGYVVTDGYQVYHKLDAEEELKVAGCWSHARRKFAEIVKSMGSKAAKGSIAADAIALIGAIYKQDKELVDLPITKRLKRRQLTVKPLVEAYFEWVKKQALTMGKGKTLTALNYSINQEKYLKVFLEDSGLPLDNNGAERALRGFCIGRNNWQVIDSLNGARASAIIYSIAETAKANNLKPYEYFKYLYEELPKSYMYQKPSDYDRLLPWSEELPKDCHRTMK